ncbi:MAG TPA: autotransporter assembly complex family protein [Pseudomonadales bacterium]|nr:autotransporter assembly complex family protein [Pseudomonadales bacterium]
MSRIHFGCFVLAALLAVTPARAASPQTRIEGVDSDLSGLVMETVPDDAVKCDTARWIVRAHLRRVEGELRKRLRARARYAPTFETTLARVDDCWQMQLGVDPGPRTLVRTLDLQVRGPGADDEALGALFDKPGFAVGDQMRESTYESLKGTIARTAIERGYFDADFEEARIDVYPEEEAADVTLHFVTGTRARFGALDVEISPQGFDDDIMARMTEWEPGAAYDLARLQDLRTRLFEAGYFEEIDVQAQPDRRDADGVPVRATMTLRPRYELSGGVGYATDLGPRLHAGIENRYLNSRGHQASATTDLSPVIQEQRLTYRLPTWGDGDPWLVFDAGHVRESSDSVDSRIVSVGARRIHGGPWKLRLAEFIDLSREEYNVSTDAETARLLTPGFSVARSVRYRDRPLEIGWRFDARVRGTAQPISTTTYLQGEVEFEGAVPLGQAARLIGRVNLGATLSDRLETLPTSVRFFAGGDRSIRGYSLDAVGPRGDDGLVRGGRHRVVGSLEAEHIVRENWSVAAFVDSGGVFNDDFDDPFFTGVGVGIRWLSPFGSIRIDLAVPLDDPDHSVRLHLGVGSTFR